jgi:hypothetical protein
MLLPVIRKCSAYDKRCSEKEVLSFLNKYHPQKQALISQTI